MGISKESSNTENSRFDPNQVQVAKVMDNRDPTRNGKLKVWIKNSQSNESDKESWITCRYASIFAGRTPGQAGADSYAQYPKSYGFWAVPPDVGSDVAVFFANGQVHEGFWFACIYDERMNSMVPGVATQVMDSSGHDMPVPVTDYDRNSIETVIDEKYVNVPYMSGLQKQNLMYDEERGTANRSSTRTVTNTVYGMNTPRGQSFVLDDGYLESEVNAPTWDDDMEGYQDTQFNNPVNDTRSGSRKGEGIALRTRGGAQLLLSESGGFVFLINRDGTARIEMTADGEISVVSDKSMSFRTDEDFNFMAAKDFNVEIGGNMNVHIGGSSILDVGENSDVSIGGQYVTNVGGECRLVSGGSTRVEASEISLLSKGKCAIQATELALLASGNISSTSAGTNNIAGSTINFSSANMNMTLSSEASCSAEIKAMNFVTPTANMNTHSHSILGWVNASSHGSEVSPPTGGGQAGSSSPAQKADPAPPANDITPSKPVKKEVQVLASTAPTQQMDDTLTEDLLAGQVGQPEASGNGAPTSKLSSYESIGMVMPCTGQIRQYGYWGKDVDTEQGEKENRTGWLIQTKGNVVSPDAGTATIIGSEKRAVMITHKNGYKSIIINVDPKIADNSIVPKGHVIGDSPGLISFVIKRASSPVAGFAGTVDPGLFYSSVTGTGADCANKSLTEGKPSVERSTSQNSTSKTSDESTELVTINKVNVIGSSTPQRGSTRVPNRTQQRTVNKNGTTLIEGYYPEDLSNIDKTPQDWIVQPSDDMLLKELKIMEGDIPYQKAVGYYRNDKFWTYIDKLGFPTIGYGHLIQKGEKFQNGLTSDQADQLLIKDVSWAVNEAKSIYKMYNMKTPYMCQIVLCQMVFGMGKGGTLKFKNTLKNMANGRYRAAAGGLRDSLYYRQIPNRAEIMAKRLEACE